MSQPPTNTEPNNGESEVEADAKPVMGRPPHEPTDFNRARVRRLSQIGMRHAEIAWMIGVSEPTMRKYYLKELMEGAAFGQEQVLETLYSMATDGKHQAATIFFAKTRCGICQPRDSEPAVSDPDAPKPDPKAKLREAIRLAAGGVPSDNPRQP